MKFMPVVFLVVVDCLALAWGQLQAPTDAGAGRWKPAGSGGTAGTAGADPVLTQEQRLVERNNEALKTAIGRAFPVTTPAEYQPLVLELYVRCQAELDGCAELLWATGLQREYRLCATTQRQICAQQIQELQAELAAITEAANRPSAVELSPEEEAILSLLGQ
ncbi:uncharacterized protein LOC125949982 [Anopheles darlingi]|uniref:uncharacterized protein LOC125949982 n=1 Tax=Anopheles darlingi TaxID=43151 RepID=UPI0021003A3B|nr:uncharacterized protein LOC125949982 [Anopheles darlingi]